MPRATTECPAPPPRAALWLVVPLAAASLGALGWVQADRLRSAGATDDPALAVAVLAAAACLAVAGWWVGGLAMLSIAAVARRLRWAGLERWATRLTPGLVARTAAAAVGLQLAVLTPAHADDAALDPFWGSATSGTEQLSVPGEQPGTTDAAPPAATSPADGTSTSGAPGTDGASAGTPGAPDPGTVTGPAAPASPEVPADGSPAAGATTSEAPTAASPSSTDLAPGQGTDQAGTRGGASPGTTSPTANPPARERVADGVITVMAGDTLWDLTSQLLGPDVSDAVVSQNLSSWLEHNTLAEHGDLIHPGDQLRVPPHLLAAQEGRG